MQHLPLHLHLLLNCHTSRLGDVEGNRWGEAGGQLSNGGPQQLPPRPLSGLTTAGSGIAARSHSNPSPTQQDQIKLGDRSYTKTPTTRNTFTKIKRWNSLPPEVLGAKSTNGLTESDQTNSRKGSSSQASKHEDRILICSQEASKPQDCWKLRQHPGESITLHLHDAPTLSVSTHGWPPADTRIQGCQTEGLSTPVALPSGCSTTAAHAQHRDTGVLAQTHL